MLIADIVKLVKFILVTAATDVSERSFLSLKKWKHIFDQQQQIID